MDDYGCQILAILTLHESQGIGCTAKTIVIILFLSYLVHIYQSSVCPSKPNCPALRPKMPKRLACDIINTFDTNQQHLINHHPIVTPPHTLTISHHLPLNPPSLPALHSPSPHPSHPSSWLPPDPSAHTYYSSSTSPQKYKTKTESAETQSPRTPTDSLPSSHPNYQTCRGEKRESGSKE